MRIIVGSTNPNKITAVKDAFSKYFQDMEVKGIAVESDVAPQPVTMEEIVAGARNRARNAYREGCTFSIGLEAGLFAFPAAKTGYLDVTCCAIFDGKDFFLGLGPAFEYPEAILEKIFKEGKEASDAADEVFKKKNIKHTEGIVGVMSKGVIKRKEFVEAAVLMALTRVVSKELYD